MSKFTINLRRILREDANITVEANTIEEAILAARLEGSSNPENYEWDCYDSEYWVDKDDAIQGVN